MMNMCLLLKYLSFLATKQNYSDAFTVKKLNYKCGEEFKNRDTMCLKKYGKTFPS